MIFLFALGKDLLCSPVGSPFRVGIFDVGGRFAFRFLVSIFDSSLADVGLVGWFPLALGFLLLLLLPCFASSVLSSLGACGKRMARFGGWTADGLFSRISCGIPMFEVAFCIWKEEEVGGTTKQVVAARSGELLRQMGKKNSRRDLVFQFVIFFSVGVLSAKGRCTVCTVL